MLISGSHTPVPAEFFETGYNTALRIERPDPRIVQYVGDYYAFDSAGPEVMGAIEWGMPSGANIRLFFDERCINVTVGDRSYAPTPHKALYGPFGRAPRVESFGGLTIGMGVTPLGWARLFSQSAHRLRDCIVPLSEVAGHAFADALYDRLAASDRSLDIKPVLDAFLLENLGPPHPDEPLIRALMGHILSDTAGDIGTLTQEMGLAPQQLRQLALRYFGFPPKRLIRRARFLRSLLKMYAMGGEADYSLISEAYFDVSHFLRDADEFLGMTPRRFMAMQTPYLRQILRVRQHVLGAPTQGLQGLPQASLTGPAVLPIRSRRD